MNRKSTVAGQCVVQESHSVHLAARVSRGFLRWRTVFSGASDLACFAVVSRLVAIDSLRPTLGCGRTGCHQKLRRFSRAWWLSTRFTLHSIVRSVATRFSSPLENSIPGKYIVKRICEICCANTTWLIVTKDRVYARFSISAKRAIGDDARGRGKTSPTPSRVYAERRGNRVDCARDARETSETRSGYGS